MSASFKERLRASAEREIALAKEQDLQVGNAEQLTLDQDVADHYGISTLARMEKNGVERVIFAAPISIDRTSWWTPVVDDHINDVAALVRGEEVELGRPRRDPRVVHNKLTSGVPNAYESKLLSYIVEQPFVLVNPAMGTLFRVSSPYPVPVCLTNNYESRREEVIRIGKQERKSFEFVKEIGDKLAYLGSNGVQDVVPRRWIALTPNPYQSPFPYENYSIKATDYGMLMNYVRNDHQTTSVLRFMPQDIYRYSPKQVDTSFFCCPSKKVKGGHYFLESSVPIEMKQESDVSEFVRYLSHYVPREDEQSYSEDDEFLYDVPGCDTYLSRYTRVVRDARMRGKKAVPLYSTHDKYGVSLASDEPRRSMVTHVVSHEGVTVFNMNNRYNNGHLESKTYILIYSPQYARTTVSLPEGGVVRAPFDPLTKMYSMTFDVPGKYFVLPFGSGVEDFFYFILRELYGNFLTPYRISPQQDHDSVDKRSKVLQILLRRPKVSSWKIGGITEVGIARRMQVSSRMIFPLLKYLSGVYWRSERVNGKIVLFFSHFLNLTQRLWKLPHGSMSYAVLLGDWYIDPRLDVPMEFLDDVTEFLRVQGLPVVKTSYKGDFARISGVVDEHARSRFLRN